MHGSQANSKETQANCTVANPNIKKRASATRCRRRNRGRPHTQLSGLDKKVSMVADALRRCRGRGSGEAVAARRGDGARTLGVGSKDGRVGWDRKPSLEATSPRSRPRSPPPPAPPPTPLPVPLGADRFLVVVVVVIVVLTFISFSPFFLFFSRPSHTAPPPAAAAWCSTRILIC